MRWVVGKAYYSFCFAIAVLGAGMISTSIYDLLGQLVLKYFEVEMPQQTTAEFLIEKLVGVALIALGIYLAYRHRQKQSPEPPSSER